jgi:hypothetical protein
MVDLSRYYAEFSESENEKFSCLENETGRPSEKEREFP